MTNSRATIILKAVATSDQTVNNSETLVNHTELFVPLKANKTYGWEMFILATSGSTPDLRFNFTLPSGATGIRNNEVMGIAPGATDDMTTNSITAMDNSNETVLLRGRVIMSSTKGNIQFQFAQGTATVADTKILQGTYLVLWEE